MREVWHPTAERGGFDGRFVVPEDGRMARAMQWMHERQVVLYLLAIAVGAALGLSVPGVAAPLQHAIAPVLAALLFVTFLAVPFSRIARLFAAVRFLASLFFLPFFFLPLVVFVLCPLVAA